MELEEYFNDEVAPAIGLKILIHDQNELPLVKENGFAVMPGATTFVSMRKRKVRNQARSWLSITSGLAGGHF